jgi:predicted DNA-binding WGR domain protein
MVTVKKKPAPSPPKEDFESFRARMLMLAERDAPEPVEEPPSSTAVDTIKSIKLYYTNISENSDKVYTLDIVKEPKFKDAYYVNFSFGRRGKNLKPGTKTKIAVSLLEAQRIFASIVAEKKAEGYTENVSGKPFSQ